MKNHIKIKILLLLIVGSFFTAEGLWKTEKSNVDEWFTALALNNTIEITNQLKLGIDVDVKNSEGKTGLMIAAYMGNLKVVQILLDNGANPFLSDKAGFNALQYAKSGRGQALAKQFIEKLITEAEEKLLQAEEAEFKAIGSEGNIIPFEMEEI